MSIHAPTALANDHPEVYVLFGTNLQVSPTATQEFLKIVVLIQVAKKIDRTYDYFLGVSSQS